ncbi:MAG: hypothetical protein J1G38_07630 [Clostridiales bacterium]|nr:hypothetical protein [Clostridiales bacterium]
MKECKACGKQNGDEDKFCEDCGAALEDEVAAVAQDDASDEKPAQKGGAVVAVRDKALKFEKQHNIIVSAITAVCALVIMFVALFAPIKVMAYYVVIPGMGAMDGLAMPDDINDKDTAGHYIEINQTIWDMFGTIGYFSLDVKNLDDAKKIKEIEDEYVAALSTMHGADEDSLADALSSMNYLAYVLATTGGKGFSEMFMGVGGAAFVTAAVLLIVTALSLAMAIVSLVHLILAILGIVGKKPTKNPFAYLGIMLGLSSAAVALCAFAPMAKIGGGTLGILLLSAILLLVCGACFSLVMGKTGLLTTIKNGAIGIVLLIATGILFTNAIELVGAATIHAPYGYGYYGVFSAMGAGAENAMASVIGATALGLIGLIFIGSACASLSSYVKYVAGVGKPKEDKRAFGNGIAAIVFMVIGIVFAYVGEPYIMAMMMNASGKLPDANALFAPQIYVSAVFFLLAVIAMKAYKPTDTPLFAAPAIEGGEPAPAPEYSSDGEPAPEAHDDTYSSVEDVAPPETAKEEGDEF